MTTVDTIINRLQNEFDCRLTTEHILSIMNNLEKRLAIDVVRRTATIMLDIAPYCQEYTIDVNPDYVTRVFVDDKEIKKQYAANCEGYCFNNDRVVLTKSFDEGMLFVEYIVVPEDILEADIRNRALFLGEGFDEIYIYHILSREALMSGDIEMLNNYSLIYAEALNSLKAYVASLPKGDDPNFDMSVGTPDAQNSTDKYKNIW